MQLRKCGPHIAFKDNSNDEIWGKDKNDDITGGSLVQHPTIWTDEKQSWEEPGKRREETRREEKGRGEKRREKETRSKKRKTEERRSRCAKR